MLLITSGVLEAVWAHALGNISGLDSAAFVFAGALIASTIGLALATVHLAGIPLTGTSVNPARSIGPALFVGGPATDQLWLFIVAPLLGGALAALVSMYLYPRENAAGK